MAEKTLIKLSFEELQKYEKELANNGIVFAGGVDEAGRGPLAGPVVAACAVFDLRKPFPEARDSKQLSEKKREALYDTVINSCVAYGVGIVDNNVIDEINILQATFKAMSLAVDEANEKLTEKTGENLSHLLIDHVHIPGISEVYVQHSITHGDALSVSIGAASIIAKVTRDRMMREYGEIYPGYGFEGHKGYGTRAHYEAIRTLGPSPIHRKTFLKNMH